MRILRLRARASLRTRIRLRTRSKARLRTKPRWFWKGRKYRGFGRGVKRSVRETRRIEARWNRMGRWKPLPKSAGIRSEYLSHLLHRLFCKDRPFLLGFFSHQVVFDFCKLELFCLCHDFPSIGAPAAPRASLSSPYHVI